MIKKPEKISAIFIGSIIIILLALFLLALKFVEPPKYIIPLTVKAAGGEIVEEIKPWYDDKGTWYFFLPSYTDFDNTILCTHERKCFLDGVPLNSEQKLDFIELEREYSFEQHFGGKEKDAKIVFMKSANVAAMYIDTRSGNMGAIYADKNLKESVSVKILNESGKIDYVGNYTDELKGRGNATWDLEKKPFLLSLSEEASLLEMSKAAKWVLLANGFDETNLRNKLIYDFASKVDMGWTPHCEYVDLYLNGEYNGLYLLSEKVEVGADRLTLNDLNNDYLFERTLKDRIKKKDISFHISDEMYFFVNYPEECDNKKLAAIQRDVYRLDEEIKAGNLSEIDLDSWVRRFLIDEVFINFDAGIASSFYHYDTASGKFYAGPIWDYDRALGNDATGFLSNMPRQIWGIRHSWYKELYENNTFYEKLKQVYRDEFLPELEKLLTYDLPYQSSKIYSASICNSIRWDEMFKNSYFPSGDKELDVRMDELSVFLQERLSYLAPVWLSDKEFEKIRWYDADKTTLLDITLAEHGTPLTEFPTQSDETLLDWYHVCDDTALDEALPVTADMELYFRFSVPSEAESTVQAEVKSSDLNWKGQVMMWLLTEGGAAVLCAIIIIVISGVVLLYIDIRRMK